ncbi:MAG: DegT/DnrJ/EryC1/StrS family aminotransferase [candidate division WOR-3 bacterium]
MIRIPLYDVPTETAWYATRLRQAFERVLAGGRFVAGPETAAFEQDLARYVGTRHAIGVQSGTDALVLALKALGIGSGDEVITTAFTFFATAEAIVLTGAKPVFADIEPTTLCLSPRTCERVVTSRTRAVLLVHLFGHCADLDQFRELCAKRRLAMVEDAAQTIGATWQGRRLGSIGEVGTFSFYPTKNLSALGNAGAVVTRSEEIADNLRSLQNHGIRDEIKSQESRAGNQDGRNPSPRHVQVGWNSRIDELQAAFLRVKLTGLENENERRRQIAARYDAELPRELRRIQGAPGCVSNYHQYAVRTEKRDELRAYLAEHGIGTGDYYRVPVYQEPAFAKEDVNCPSVVLSETETACREVLTLPVRPSLTDEEQTAVIEAVRRFFSAGEGGRRKAEGKVQSGLPPI